MTVTVQTLAAELRAAFVSATRTNGATFYKLAEGSPEWMTDVIHAAHGDMLPDDWRYAAIRRTAGEIAECEDLDDDAAERVDSMVDCYNSALCEWLASSVARISYCDDAAEEFGYFGEQPRTVATRDDRGIVGLMQLGQYAEYQEIWGQLVAALGEEADGREPVMTWAAGFNMPGYMPESEPAHFETWEEARDSIREEIERALDEDESARRKGGRDVEALAALEALGEGEEFGRTVGAYHYWVSRI